LYDDVLETRVLDLYCGTGSFGLEALSRGAAYCTFVDIKSDFVKKNCEMAERGTFRVVKGKVEAVMGRLGEAFDVIFIDPPYQTVDPNELLKSIVEHELLANDGIIIYEESVRAPFVYPEETFVMTSEKKYGDTKIYYLSVKK